MNRRRFLQAIAGTASVMALNTFGAASQPGGKVAAGKTVADEQIRQLIDAHRPSRLKRLPANFNARVGAAHVAGKYHLTHKPFLIEGAEKLLALGTRLGKFWFMPASTARSYPFNSQWQSPETLVDLARSDHFRQLFALPFSTIILEAAMPREWPASNNRTADSLKEVTQSVYGNSFLRLRGKPPQHEARHRDV